MSTASLDRVKVALLRELEVTFQSHFHQHLTEVVTELGVRSIGHGGGARADEVFSAIRASGILQLMGGTELASLRGAIERLSKGEFGLCLRCGRKIALQDLEASPTTQFCSRCRTGARLDRRRVRSKVRHSSAGRAG